MSQSDYIDNGILLGTFGGAVVGGITAADLAGFKLAGLALTKSATAAAIIGAIPTVFAVLACVAAAGFVGWVVYEAINSPGSIIPMGIGGTIGWFLGDATNASASVATKSLLNGLGLVIVGGFGGGIVGAGLGWAAHRLVNGVRALASPSP